MILAGDSFYIVEAWSWKVRVPGPQTFAVSSTDSREVEGKRGKALRVPVPGDASGKKITQALTALPLGE